jgi:predicted transcriptional regulator
MADTDPDPETPDASPRDREREAKRESFRLETLAAWEHYQATGLHLTQEEAEAWMAQLVAGLTVDPPECHT